jgi:hypothetical protein
MSGEEKQRKSSMRKKAMIIGCVVLLFYVGFILLMGNITPGFGPSDPASFDQMSYRNQ